MQTINSYLPMLDLANNGVAFSEEKLVRVVIRNTPRTWKTRFKMTGAYHSATVAHAAKILGYTAKESQMVMRTPRISSGRKGKDSGRSRKSKGDDGSSIKGSKSLKNPWKLPGHQNHDWKDYSYNPKGKNFKGKGYVKKCIWKSTEFMKRIVELIRFLNCTQILQE